MKKVSLVVHNDYLDDIIKKIHKNGIIEITNISAEKPNFINKIDKSSVSPDAPILANYDLRLSRLIDILKSVIPKSKGIKSLLNPKLPVVKEIEENDFEEICSNAEGLLANIEKEIILREGKLKDYKEKQEKLNLILKQLKYLIDFDIDISRIGDSDLFYVKAGLTTDIAKLKELLESVEESAIYSKKFGKRKHEEWAVLVISHKSKKDKIEKICREFIDDFNFGDYTGKPMDLIDVLKLDLEKNEKEQKKIIADLIKYSKNIQHELLSVREEIRIEKDRNEIFRNFGSTNKTSIINGWILEKNEENLRQMVKEGSDDYIIFESEIPSLNPDNPPTYVDIPKWARGFKTLLNMFATPKYNELNPTLIMGFFFVLFFGIMLGDAGYGMILLFLSLFGYHRFRKYSDLIGNWSFIGIWMGLITTTVGLLTNSFFGDFISRFIYGDPGIPIYSISILGINLPAEPLNDPLTILAIALIFGLIHLNVGIVLGIYQAYKQKKYRAMLSERLCWIPLQFGGGVLIGYYILDWIISDTMFYFSIILVVIGLIQLFISSGPIGFFDITGYVGDWLSYARLLALGLATAGMALAFNVVSELIPGMIPYIGIVLLPVLLVVLHIVNLGLQALGAGVHSLRLQYVEFFNRFYEGGGREFSPFRINRKFTKIYEEKN